MIADPREMKLGLADYLSLPEDEDREREVIGGKLYVTPRPGFDHQWIVAELWAELSDYLLSCGGNRRQLVIEADLLLDSRNTYVSPDLMYFGEAQLPSLYQLRNTTKRIAVDAAKPEMVLEVLSESDRARDLVAKLSEYEQAGIHHYWIIDPQERSFREFVLDKATAAIRCWPAPAALCVHSYLRATNHPLIWT